MRAFVVAVVLALAASCAGSKPGGPYASQDAARRDTSAAEALNREAAAQLDTDPQAAEGVAAGGARA